MRRPLTLMALCAAMIVVPACSSETSSGGAGTGATDSRSLDTNPLSAVDYRLYVTIMSGASAMLADLTPDDRHALELARQVDARQHTPTPEDERLLLRARALQHKDEELAELQDVGVRYRQVKSRVMTVIGPTAQPPADDDAIARENRRFLEPNRANIERLQKILRDPLSR